MKRESQNDRILAALRSDEARAFGGWLTTERIHRRAGFSRLNSRVSELREHGFLIECRRVPGEPSGPRAQEYRLVEPLETAASCRHDSLGESGAAVSSGPAYPDPLALPPDGVRPSEAGATEPLFY